MTDSSTAAPVVRERYVVNAPIEKIRVPSNRLRELRDYSGLAASMDRLGLLSPITITESGLLVSGRHRLEAARSLGWQTISSFVVEDDELENRLQEIDENLKRLDLTVYEQAKHAEERERVLEALGARLGQGSRTDLQPSATVAGSLRTKDVAKEAGMSERSWQGRVKIGQALGEQTRTVLDHADPTDDTQRNLLNSTTQLDHLANIANKHGDDVAAEVAEKALSENRGNTFTAYKELKGESLGKATENGKPKKTDTQKARDNFNKLLKNLYELSAGIEHAGGLKKIVAAWPEQDQRFFVESYRQLGERVSKQVDDFQSGQRGGD